MLDTALDHPYDHERCPWGAIVALVLLMTIGGALAEEPAPADGPACVHACLRASDICVDLAGWMLEAFPGQIGEKYYVLQTWACFESTARCVGGC